MRLSHLFIHFFLSSYPLFLALGEQSDRTISLPGTLLIAFGHLFLAFTSVDRRSREEQFVINSVWRNCGGFDELRVES
jgi:hypothetical protein